MNVKPNLKVILTLITGLTVIALLYFIFKTESDNPEKTAQPVTAFSKDKFLFDIDSILFSFGIKKDWIKDIGIKEKESKKTAGQVLLSKEVKIPNDLPTIDLNYEITNYLRSGNFSNNVTEDPKSKNIQMIFFSGDSLQKQTGTIKFIYSDTLKRIAAEVCLVLDSLDGLSLYDAENILNSTQTYSVMLPLRNDKADYQSKIMELKRDYLIKFSVGSDDDIDADFKEGTKESSWKSKIKSLNINFPGVSGIILVNRIPDSEFYNSVKEEFVKNSIPVYSDSVFNKFHLTKSKVISLFDNIISETKSGKKILFYDMYFNPDEFADYDKQVYILKKSGFRFFNFKELMSRVNKTQ